MMGRLFGLGLAVLMVWPAVVAAQLSLDDAMTYSGSGVVTQKFRLGLIAENVANASTLRVRETGLPYRKKYAVMTASQEGVRVARVGESNDPFPKYFDPAVPQANEDGFFSYPNVNLPDEMINMSYTEAVYESNIAAFKSTKAMYTQAMELLK